MAMNIDGNTYIRAAAEGVARTHDDMEVGSRVFSVDAGAWVECFVFVPRTSLRLRHNSGPLPSPSFLTDTELQIG